MLVAVDTLAVNLTAYYQYVSQSTMRFKELSIRKILFALFKIGLIIIIYILSKTKFEYFANVYLYILGLVIIDWILMLWYMVTYKDLVLGTSDSFLNCKNDIILLFKKGIILTIAFQASQIIFSLDSQFVSVLYNAHVYGIYSFAYNIISMVMTIVSAIALVLFPRLKQLRTEEIMQSFTKAMATVGIVAAIAMLGYQPLCYVINCFLPDYSESLIYLRVIIPGLALSCCINIIMFTYYKAIDAYFIYFKVSCSILFLSGILNFIVYKIGNKPIYISIASIVSLFIWYVWAELYFIVQYNIRWKKNLFYILIIMFGFYGITYKIEDLFISWISYLLLFVIITLGIFRNEIVELFRVQKDKR